MKGIIMLNLGSPDSTEIADVRKYLKEFLLDGRVLDAPEPIRKLVVNAFILPFRPKTSAEAYKEIWTDEGSPLIVISRKLRDDIAAQVDIPVELAMRYGNPSTPDAVQRLVDMGVDDLYIMPMYPHYAMSSYETAVVHVMDQIRELKPEMKTTLLQPYYQDPQYIEALVENIRPYLEADYDRLIFSYHGIPQRHLVKGDPSHNHCMQTPDCCNVCNPAHATCYRHQCAMTTEKVVAALELPREKYMITFQSRLGREPWLQPYTDKTLEALPDQGVKKVAILCPAFTADCLETLEEISGEGREIFLENGGESFTFIPCLNEQPLWKKFILDRIAAFVSGELEPARLTEPAYVASS
ncbi:MAG: ferrochelatase [Opitutales bacterium]|nr:ferrochelatase [Opitutales bacterium]NRA26531.1 ferrochelatase [Opitutales bacterium]